MDPRPPRRVAVIGAGMAGLVAARRLARTGVEVVLLEAGGRLGGQVETLEAAPGTHLDQGAEALHLAAPGVAALVEELGLRDSMVRCPFVGSSLLTDRGLRPVPPGVGPAGPGRLWPVLRSRTMSWSGLARAGLEPVAARRMAGLAPDEDVSVGDFVTGRFGPEVTRTFVAPLLGNLHAGDVSRLSLRACAPALVPAAAHGRSLLTRRRSSRAVAGMALVTWAGGLSTLVDGLVKDGPPAEVRTGTPVTGLAHAVGGGYDVVTPAWSTAVDAVVLATPARAAAELLAELAPGAASTLRAVEYADLATVLVGVPRTPALEALRGTGLLVPAGRGRVLKAATYLSRKWPHLAGSDTFWLRLSAGRAGDAGVLERSDEHLVAALLADLEVITGLHARPTDVRVRRWPAAMPQLNVGHPARIAEVRAALPPGVALAGASYDGVGLASCIRSGEAAATGLGLEEGP